MSKITILGGGVGGIVAARGLRTLLPKEHEIVLVEKRATFHLGATKTWVMLGHRTAEEVNRPLDNLKKHGIQVVRAEIQAIDAAARKVNTSDGEIEADYLVIALGADLNLGAIPGAHTFYTMEGAVKLGEALRQFKGGEIVIVNPKMPIKCPPAPYELAMLLHYEFKFKEVKPSISFYTVEPTPMPTAGPEVSKFMRAELEKRGIRYFPQKKLKSVDASKRVVSFEDGDVPYDLLIAVPPHEAPKVVRDAGLTDKSGWIPVDPKTLRSSIDRVYAIGDVSVVPLPGRYKPDVPLVLPKAAVFAEAHAKVVATHIASQILGKGSVEEFQGKGFCFVELGEQHAMAGEGLFFETPSPKVTPRVPDKSQFEQKLRWAQGFMDTYLS